jgi:hypothetical protein
LFSAHHAVHGGLDFFCRQAAALADERRNAKLAVGMLGDFVDDLGGANAEHAGECAVEFEVGHGETVLGAVFPADAKCYEFSALDLSTTKPTNFN